MLVGAILIVDPAAPGESLPSWAGASLACVEVLGRSALHRTIAILLQAGVQPITVVGSASVLPRLPRLAVRFVEAKADGGEWWKAAEGTFVEYVRSGSGIVLVQRLGGFVDLKLTELLWFHVERNTGLTRARHDQEPLDLWSIDVELAQRGTIAGLRDLTRRERGPALAEYPVKGYCNPLRDAHDVRRMAVDGLLAAGGPRPSGLEARPGIWVEDSAQIHRGARIVAPAYIGHKARVRSSSLVTRCSSLEHGSEVDYGTVVEDTSVLDHTYLGPGLDIAHAVVAGRHYVDLRRNLELEISDKKLIAGTAPARAMERPWAFRSLLAAGARWTTHRAPRVGGS